MPTKQSYAQLLETNHLIRHASDTSLWLCRSRTDIENCRAETGA